MEGSCVVPASAARCVRPLLGGEGAGEGEPTSVQRSPAREVEEAAEETGRDTNVVKTERELSPHFES